MMKMLTLMVIVCVVYVNSVPPDRRVRRGFNNSGGGYGSERGGGYYNRGSDERDASVSRESGQECDSDENSDSREHTYGDSEYEQRQNEKHFGGRNPH